MKRNLILFIFFILISCDTLDVPPPYIVPLEELLIEDVRELISRESYLNALQHLATIERKQSNIEQTEIDMLRNEALAGVVALFNKAIGAGEYSLAISYYNSLQNIYRSEMISDWSIKDLLLKYAYSLEQSGDISIAILVFMDALENSDLDNEEIEYILEFLVNNNKLSTLQIFIGKMQEKGYSIPEKYLINVQENIPLYKMIDGTVTIWVNKGVKIESGVGLPDYIIGSGFFIDKRGYLLTNYHVIESEVDPKYEGFSRLYVRLSDKPEQKIPAKVVGYDRIFDLALIKVEISPKYIFSSLGETDIKPGDKISVIGSPVGLENTITSGIISATGRRFLQLGDTIQIDAPVNRGNSGGPLINEKGVLIGIIFAGLEQFEGLNFAVSSEWINKLLPMLFEGDEINHYWMGMAITEVKDGLEVIYTVPGEPASLAGIKSGDIIKQMNGQDFKKIEDIQSSLLDFNHPTLVSLVISRENKEYIAVLNLKKRPYMPFETALKRDARVNILYPLFGMKVQSVGSFFWDRHYIIQKIVDGSIADEIGLSINDEIYIRGWEVDNNNGFVFLQIKAKKQKMGFIDSFIQIAAYLQTNDFI